MSYSSDSVSVRLENYSNAEMDKSIAMFLFTVLEFSNAYRKRDLYFLVLLLSVEKYWINLKIKNKY